jgi:nucleotide-binding universal stress UspA family protein
MYRRIVLAYDGTVEGRAALREGALLAKACGAQAYLLSVAPQSAGLMLGDSALPGAIVQENQAYREVLAEGLERLRALGMSPQSALVSGEPIEAIAAYARQVEADLVVVGYRHRSALARWWIGSTSAQLSERLTCSLLVSRNDVSDEEFAAAKG